jgi:DNA polymerase III subunit delta'
MSFNSIIGQKAVKEQLVHMVQHNRLSHALLFLGKEGSGALQLAMEFAQFITCKPTTDNGQQNEPSLFGEPEPTTSSAEAFAKADDSCGVCPSCKKAQELVHPDIHFSYPVIPRKSGDKPIATDYITEWREFVKISPYGNVYDWLQFINAENKQGNITAHECNDILRKLSLKSFESEYKILIMWMPEYLGKEGNKLLKLIEEPPANTLFILVAENEDQILPTIISRTQLVKIPALTKLDIESALELRASVPVQKAQQIAAVAEGNYREALQMLQHSEDDWQSMLREWLNAVVKFNPQAQVKWIDETAKIGREKQKQFLQYFTHLLELAVRISTTNDQPPTSNEVDFALRLNKITQLHQQEAIINELNKASYYIERNANAKMLFHALSIKLYHIISNNSLILVN